MLQLTDVYPIAEFFRNGAQFCRDREADIQSTKISSAISRYGRPAVDGFLKMHLPRLLRLEGNFQITEIGPNGEILPKTFADLAREYEAGRPIKIAIGSNPAGMDYITLKK